MCLLLWNRRLLTRWRFALEKSECFVNAVITFFFEMIYVYMYVRVFLLVCVKYVFNDN